MRGNGRIQSLLVFLAIYLVIGLLTRLCILNTFSVAGVSVFSGGLIFGLGFLNDLVTFLYLGLPVAAVVTLFLDRPGREPGAVAKSAAFILFFVYLGIWLFTATAEYFFWEEFGSRFNFIAVDYLIYTTELARNIIESYPLSLILTGIFIASALPSYLIYKVGVRRAGKTSHLSRPARAAFLAFWLAALVVLHWSYRPPAVSGDNQINELSYNGIYRLFSAYRHNQLDYRQFYPVMEATAALDILRDSLSQPETVWDQRPESLTRRVESKTSEKRLNVIQIVVESLGSDLLGEDTPNLNALIDDSLYFANLRATGTRTVRGIEALTLGVPPTPGSSIVRRPENDGLFNLGAVFQDKGYETTFVYGGFGYFDNMNAFFAGNGFNVIDRYQMPGEEISFANVWGVCDEDLYMAALKNADLSYEAGKPFYQFVLTTSNHRPFTYPEGKVAIASGEGRKGAVQYTDYAIGRFMAEARSKAWFNDTVFVIVADHTAGIAGKTVIPPERYLIPGIIYSPAHVSPKRLETLCSQIDLPPTLLSLLGFSYENAFFGLNILDIPPDEGRAYLGTYQLLGLMDNQSLVILAPNQLPEIKALTDVDELDAVARQAMVQKAIAAYQTAQDFFSDGRMKQLFVFGLKPARQFAKVTAPKLKGRSAEYGDKFIVETSVTWW